MDVFHLALYVLASFAALRSLISMMASHKARYASRRWAETAKAKAAAAPEPVAIPAKSSKNGKSAA